MHVNLNVTSQKAPETIIHLLQLSLFIPVSLSSPPELSLTLFTVSYLLPPPPPPLPLSDKFTIEQSVKLTQAHFMKIKRHSSLR